MNKILVFSDLNFPGYKESNVNKLEGAFICDAKTLGDALLQDYDVFVNLHGSHFPLSAVDSYYKFLQKGKGYVQCFGAPLEYVYSVNKEGAYVCENKQMSYYRKLHIHSVLPVSQNEVTEYIANVENQVAASLSDVLEKEETLNFVLTPTKDAYVEKEWGSIGSMDSYIRPLIMGMDAKNQHISSPVVLMENRGGVYAGSRWIFVNSAFKEDAYGKLAEFIAPLAQFVAAGHREITVKPSYAMYEVGEKPVIAIAAQNFKKISDWKVSMKIYGGDEKKELWADTISLKGQSFPSQINVVPGIEVTPGIYEVVTEWHSEDGEAQCIFQGFCVRDEAVLKSLETVKCTKDYFVIDGKMQAIVGTTYMSGEVSRSYLQLPNVSNWLNDMREMKRVGLNWLRTGIWCNHRRFMLDDGHFDEFILRSIDAFVQVAATVGFHVTFTFFPFVPEAFEGSHPYLDRRSIEAQKRFIAKVVERHKDSTNIDWDLINEPFTSDHPSQKKKDDDILEDLDFRAYMEKKYGRIDKLLWSLDRTATEIPSFDALPLPTADKINFEVNDMAAAKNGIIWVDYQNYRMDMFKRWMIELRDMIQTIAPGHLVTVGQDEALHAQRPSPLIYGKELDYNNMHSWWLMDDLVWDTRFAKADGKPLLVQETGIMYTEAPNGVPRRSEADLAKILRRKFAYAYGTKCAGAIHWLWNTNYYMNNANESNIGAIRCDRSRKPEFMAYEQFARFFEKTQGIISDIVDDEQVAVIFPYSNDFSNKSFAQHATKHITKILTYQMKVPFVGVGEYDLAQLKRQDFRVIFVPSAHHFETKQFEELLAIAEEKGSTIVFTGPISYDEHFIKTDRVKALVGETTLHGLSRFEEVTYGDKSYLFSFDNTYVSRAFREVSSDGECVVRQLGKGKIIWFASPLEICAESEKLAELYAGIFKECGVRLPFEVCAESGKEAILSAVFVTKTTWEKGALYTLVNESSTDVTVTVRDVASRCEYKIMVPAEDVALVAIDAAGKEVVRF